MKKKFFVCLTALVCLTLITCFSHNKTYAKANTLISNGSIIVSGQAEVNLKPDAARITFSIESLAESMEEATTQSSQAVEELTNSLKNHDINEKSLKTESFYAYKKHNYEEGRQVFAGYNVCNTLSLSVENLEIIDQLITTLSKNSVTSFSGIHFYKKNSTDEYNTALSNALKNAEEKAKLLTGDSKLYLVKLVEQGFLRQSTHKTMMDASQSSVINGDEIKIVAKVKAFYSQSPTPPTASFFEQKNHPPNVEQGWQKPNTQLNSGVQNSNSTQVKTKKNEQVEEDSKQKQSTNPQKKQENKPDEQENIHFQNPAPIEKTPQNSQTTLKQQEQTKQKDSQVQEDLTANNQAENQKQTTPQQEQLNEDKQTPPVETNNSNNEGLNQETTAEQTLKDEQKKALSETENTSLKNPNENKQTEQAENKQTEQEPVEIKTNTPYTPISI